MLEDKYDICEAENGKQAVEILERCHKDFKLVLLDLIMPVMDGYQVLAVMKEKQWLDMLPVICISSETSEDSIRRVYGLGASDYFTRPFDAMTVFHRVESTIALHDKMTGDLQDAMKMLSSIFHRILKINLSTDTYTVIRGKDSTVFMLPSLSESLKMMADHKYIYEEDREEYLKFCSIDNLRRELAKGRERISLNYRTLIKQEYRWVCMEVIRSAEYKPDDQIAMMYIRDINDEYLVMVVSDRISAFDVILPEGVPYKGQVLNQIASKFLDATADIVPNWKIATPDPMVTVGHKCEPFKVEMVIRGYLTGSSWRAYKSGERTLCGLPLPEGMRENQKFDSPLITPTTKADEGHDENISKEEIIAQGLVSREDYELMEKYTYALFQRGTEIAAEKGLILVDTKYEFGKKNGRIYLIDEIHTPDSSRYFYAEGYEERFAKGEKQKQLSKEFVREWLMDNGFQGQAGQKVPEMTPAVVAGITDRYIELYEHITGQKFVKADSTHVLKRIEDNVNACLKTL